VFFQGFLYNTEHEVYAEMPMNELRRLRKAKRLSQAKLAALADLDPSTVNQIETGARQPNTRTLEKLAAVLGVGVGDLYPKAQAPLPLEEEPLMSRPSVRRWLRERGATLALMSEREFAELVLGMDLEVTEDGYPEGIERFVRRLWEEEDQVISALMREFAHGGELFPLTEKGPDLVERAFRRHKEVTRLKRELRRAYGARQLGLTNYSRRLYLSGKTSDFLVHARAAEGVRRLLLEEAFAETGAA
jgi:transcriptional regulator with XRE-family HTH domain